MSDIKIVPFDPNKHLERREEIIAALGEGDAIAILMPEEDNKAFLAFDKDKNVVGEIVTQPLTTENKGCFCNTNPQDRVVSTLAVREGADPDMVVDALLRAVLPKGTNTAFHAILPDPLASAVERSPSVGVINIPVNEGNVLTFSAIARPGPQNGFQPPRLENA